MKGVMEPRAVSCLVCGTEFSTTHSQGKYCSTACQREGERKSWREYGRRNADARRLYHQQLYARDPSKVQRRVEAYRQTPAGKASQRVHDQRQKEKSPEKYAARQAVLVAIRSGKLKRRPCERCGAGKAHAHHSDYSKPLDVTWLCPPCHRAEHTES